jgi:hypothetical protein
MGNWNLDVLTLPERLVVTAAHPGGPELSRATLVPRNPGTPYEGHLTILETGPADLGVTIPGTGAPDQPISSATFQLNVIEGGRPASASPSAPAVASPVPTEAPQDGIPLVVWVAGIGALLIVGGLVLRRVFADL